MLTLSPPGLVLRHGRVCFLSSVHGMCAFGNHSLNAQPMFFATSCRRCAFVNPQHPGIPTAWLSSRSQTPIKIRAGSLRRGHRSRDVLSNAPWWRRCSAPARIDQCSGRGHVRFGRRHARAALKVPSAVNVSLLQCLAGCLVEFVLLAKWEGGM